MVAANKIDKTPHQSKEVLKPLRGLLPFLAKYRGMLILALFALLFAAGMTLILPVAVRYMIDFGFSKDNIAYIDRYFILFIIVGILLAVSSALRHYAVSWLGERVVCDIRRAVYKHVLKLSPEFYEKTKVGEILSRLTTDTTLIDQIVGTGISMALRNLIMMLGALVMMFVTSLYLSSFVLFFVPFVVMPIIFLARRYRRLSRVSQDAIAHSSAYASESLNAVHLIQAFTHEKYDIEQYIDAVEKSFYHGVRRIKLRSIFTVVIIALVISAVTSVLWLGARLVLVEPPAISMGQLSQFVIYAVLVASASGTLSEVWGDVQRAAGASERLNELLNVKSPVSSPKHPVDIPTKLSGEIRFDNISFSYPARPNDYALKTFSLHIPPGETIALVGASGAGKSTVFQLLQRFYAWQTGEIYLDKYSLATLSLENLRYQFSLVPQETTLFSNDVLENIRYGNPTASDAEVMQVAKLALVDEFVSNLTDGYKTFLGEKGIRLSGGQRQRIAIARAMLRKSPILLLDEATSALDSENENLVQIALASLMQGRTTLIIAHRLSTVMNADRIVLMKNGEIEAIGKHAELLKKSKHYANLVALQFKQSISTRGDA